MYSRRRPLPLPPSGGSLGRTVPQAYLHELREWIAGEEEAAAEEMSAFFTKRLAHYEDVHLGNWGELYAHIADFFDGGLETLLDIGCGTGLELEAVYRRFPEAAVTGIDLSGDMSISST